MIDFEIPDNAMLLLDSASGVYIPQRFAEEIDRDCVYGVSDYDFAILEAGPDNDQYWDSWADVLDRAQILDGDTVYRLEQDGDVWLIPVAYTVTAPAHWATALINGDYSGIEDENEDAAIESFERSLDGHIVDVIGEPEFMAPQSTDTPSQLAGDYIRYVIITSEE